MAKENTYPKNIFTSLNELLQLESFSKNSPFLAKKQRVSSVLGGKHASKLRGRGLDFEEVRNYVPGDDIRTIDWKVTARTQKTHTKVYSEEKEKPALIIVDQTKSMFFGSKLKMKSVVAAELAATAAFKVIKEGDRVGGIIIGDDKIDIVYPKRDRKNILLFLEKLVENNRALLNSKASNMDTKVQNVFQKIRNLVTHDFLVVVISDFQRYDKKVIKNISYIAQHNDVVLAKIYDPMERNIPNTEIIATDGKMQVLVQGRNSNIRRKARELFDSDFSQFEDTMKKYRIPLFKINTVEPIKKQLEEVFKSVR